MSGLASLGAFLQEYPLPLNILIVTKNPFIFIKLVRSPNFPFSQHYLVKEPTLRKALLIFHVCLNPTNITFHYLFVPKLNY